MRCLHCGKKLSLLRKLSDSEFCTDSHRQLFQQQQSDLALARLIEAQNRSLRPRAPLPGLETAPVEAPVAAGPGEVVFPMAGVLRAPLAAMARRGVLSPAVEASPSLIERALPDQQARVGRPVMPAPGAMRVEPCGAQNGVASHGSTAEASFSASSKLPAHGVCPGGAGLKAWTGLENLAVAVQDGGRALVVAGLEAEAIEGEARPKLPASALAVEEVERVELSEAPGEAEPARASAVASGWRFEAMDAAGGRAAWAVEARWAVAGGAKGAAPAWKSAKAPGLRGVGAVEWTAAALAGESVLRGAATAEFDAQGAALPVAPPAEVATRSLAQAGEARLAACAPCACEAVKPPALSPRIELGGPALPARAGKAAAARAQLKACGRQAKVAVKAMAASAGGRPVECGSGRFAEAGPVVNLHAWFAPRVAMGEAGLVAAARDLALDRAPELRTAVLAPAGFGWSDEVAAPASGLRPAAVEAPAAEPLRVEAAEAEPDVVAPAEMRGMRALPIVRPVEDPASGAKRQAKPVECVWPERAEPAMPPLALVLDHADGSGSRQDNGARAGRRWLGDLRLDGFRLPRRAWSYAPRDLKWVAAALPLLLILVLYSTRDKGPERAAGGAAETKTAATKLNAFQKAVMERAAVKLFDDFRGGLGSWRGKGDWAKTWHYDQASFLEPGQMALYEPTTGMVDYSMQFLGQIEKRSLNWVFRASDERNYYSIRILITKAGPLPEAKVVRSVVIDGKERDQKTLPLPFPVRSDTLYLVRMDVRGQDFTTYIQGQVVDTFSDSRLERGGVGFYSPKGDRSLLRWVEVTHQYDYLGRLCALLAPYPMPANAARTN